MEGAPDVSNEGILTRVRIAVQWGFGIGVGVAALILAVMLVIRVSMPARFLLDPLEVFVFYVGTGVIFGAGVGTVQPWLLRAPWRAAVLGGALGAAIGVPLVYMLPEEVPKTPLTVFSGAGAFALLSTAVAYAWWHIFVRGEQL